MRFLLFISQNYSFEILRPIQAQAKALGDEVKWLVFDDKLDLSRFVAEEDVTSDINEAIKFNPDATFVPGNVVPSFIPGIKVQVFHGLEWKKKGHFNIRDCFDLYCTQGAFFTDKFQQLADTHKNFDVVETGWPKLDGLFSAEPYPRQSQELPCILYAPTFSPSMTSAQALFEEIVEISKSKPFHWIIKFHPKMDATTVQQYQSAQHDKLKVIDASEVAPLLQCADVIVSDTSSIIAEFLLLGKPAVTFKNVQPESVLIDIEQASLLSEAIEQALVPNQEKQVQIEQYKNQMHPYQDGLSALRVINAAKEIINNGKKAPKKLPKNRIRNLKMRKIFNYWR